MLRQWFARGRQIKPLGERGEDAATRYLKRLGYKILVRHQRGAGRGEIDIIAVDLHGARGRTIVFVEVKTRRSLDKGHPADAVDRDKQQQLTRLALSYLKRHGLLEYPSRFDVIAVIWPADARRPQIEHFVNAFEAVGRGQEFS